MKPFEEDQAKIESLEERVKSLEERVKEIEEGGLAIYAMHMTLLEIVADYEARYLINRDKLEKL